MLTSKKDEIQQRLNSILQKLSGITFVPENWNEAHLWNTLNDTGFTQEDVLYLNWSEFSQKFIDLKWPWEHIEKLADILLALDAKQPNAVLKERAKNMYQFIQSESKIFSFEIVAKINKIK